MACLMGAGHKGSSTSSKNGTPYEYVSKDFDDLGVLGGEHRVSEGLVDSEDEEASDEGYDRVFNGDLGSDVGRGVEDACEAFDVLDDRAEGNHDEEGGACDHCSLHSAQVGVGGKYRVGQTVLLEHADS